MWQSFSNGGIHQTRITLTNIDKPWDPGQQYKNESWLAVWPPANLGLTRGPTQGAGDHSGTSCRAQEGTERIFGIVLSITSPAFQQSGEDALQHGCQGARGDQLLEGLLYLEATRDLFEAGAGPGLEPSVAVLAEDPVAVPLAALAEVVGVDAEGQPVPRLVGRQLLWEKVLVGWFGWVVWMDCLVGWFG